MYEKRLCILKQMKKGFSVDGSSLTGAIYAERLGSELIITPRIPALAPLQDGRYALALCAGERSFVLELKGNIPLKAPADFSLKGGFSALLCFVRGEAEPIAFGACGDRTQKDREFLLSLFSKREAREETLQEESHMREEEEMAKEEEKDEREAGNEQYDDEAIADADYFRSVCEDAQNADDGGANSQKGEEKGAGVCENEEDKSVHPFLEERGSLTYYYEIAPKIKEAMQKYPRDEKMEKVFPHSEWVKAEGALLGVIYAEGLPRFLCVAMRNEPPKEVKEYSLFVPDSPYSEEEGYFVVFQDADSGEYVKIEES